MKVSSKLTYYFLVSIFVLGARNIYGQQKDKPSIDTSVFAGWQSVDFGRLSPNGKYAIYDIHKGNSTVQNPLFTRVIKSATSSWQIEIHGLDNAWNSCLGNDYALMMKDDTLIIVELGKGIHKLPGIDGFKGVDYTSMADNGSIIVQKKNEIFLLDKTRLIPLGEADNFQLLHDGTVIAKRREGSDATLARIQPGKGEQLLWKGGDIGSLVFNQDKSKVAFLVKPRHDAVTKQVIVIDFKTGSAVSLSNTGYEELTIDQIDGFNITSEKLIVKLKGPTLPVNYQPSPVQLKVWGTMDELMQKEQVKRMNEPKSVLAVFDLKNQHLVRLQQDYDDIYSGDYKKRKNVELVMQRAGNCNGAESDFNPSCKKSWYIVDLNTGDRKLLPRDADIDEYYHHDLSPSEKFAVYYDFQKGYYFSYNVASGELINLTKDIDKELLPNKYDIEARGLWYFTRGIAGWVKNEETVLVYGDYDIWQLDLHGTKPPLNLTKDIKTSDKIKFRLFEDQVKEYEKGGLVVQGFNTTTKDDGFYRVYIGEKKPVEKLSSGPYKYREAAQIAVDANKGMAPVKAANAELYLVSRQSSTSSPNFFLTRDFKQFKPLSDVYPERDYNWLTTELHTFKTPGGRLVQGVLYKPQNFDPTKKYPIIFKYYEQTSGILNTYIQPQSLCGGCTINAPYMVANGYLVFMPDIDYKVNEAGKSAQISVESAARHLAQFPWADTSRMGIQGCSWGGFETNYIATNSTMFKAAFEASGAIDAVTTLAIFIVDKPYYAVHGQHLFKSFPWENPQAYQRESVIYNANKIQTPLLIMHTTIDGAVPFNEAMQFFTILRRLRKKAWLLEYSGPKANHGLFDPAQASDLSIRALQFFDHYLKGKPAPVWMTKGIDAAEAKTNDGLQLDESAQNAVNP